MSESHALFFLTCLRKIYSVSATCAVSSWQPFHIRIKNMQKKKLPHKNFCLGNNDKNVIEANCCRYKSKFLKKKLEKSRQYNVCTGRNSVFQ